MGCFDATCMVSNIGIGAGDSIVMLRIARLKREDRGSRRSAFNTPGVNMLYPGEEWAPIGLPFFGEYDDYGRIENVAETPSVVFTRDLLNEGREDEEPWTVEDLCDREIDGQTIRTDDGVLTLAKTFMHRRLWDHLTQEISYEIGYDRQTHQVITSKGTTPFRERLDKLVAGLRGKSKRSARLAKIDDPAIKDYIKTIDDYEIYNAIRGGEGDHLYGGRELLDCDRSLFLSEFPAMMALRASMHLLRRSYLPTQTIGEQHTDDRHMKRFLDVCGEIVDAKIKEIEDDDARWT